MLADGKSWVSKEAEIFPEITDERSGYKMIVDTLAEENPELSPQQVYDAIRAIEAKYNYTLFRQYIFKEPHQKEVLKKREFSVLEDLGILSKEQQTELNALRSDYKKSIDIIVAAIGGDPVAIEKEVEEALLSDSIYTLAEVEQLMINGPIIEGFSETKDVRISDEMVAKFLKDCFGLEVLRKAKITRVIKDDQYLIGGIDSMDEVNALAQTGFVPRLKGVVKNFLAKDRESYERAAMFLEKVDDPSKLQHTFQLCADAGKAGKYQAIRMWSFGVESSTDLDYLTDVPLESEDDKMRAYILGTLAHEVGHRLEMYNDAEIYSSYSTIVEEERSSLRPQYVSVYVLQHKEVFKSPKDLIIQEDFSDTIFIYVTNPAYLQKHYPRRFAFIQEHFPTIKQGSATDAVKELS